jgi:hypothetical protein
MTELKDYRFIGVVAIYIEHPQRVRLAWRRSLLSGLHCRPDTRLNTTAESESFPLPRS